MMKNVLIVFCVLCVINCDNSPKSEKKISRKFQVEQSRFPTVLEQMFEVHGGLNSWEQMKRLEFSFDNSNTTERHSVDLKSRKTLIESEAYTIGFDGSNTWIKSDNNTLNIDPKFYYNRMFYLYAMPFVVSDPGIFYTERKDATLEFERYGALHIGFRRSIGTSPQDEYIIYYNKKTMEMTWLAYTVTYFDKKRSTDWYFVKYDNWQEVNGLKLPKTMITYSTKDDKPFKPIRTIDFFDVSVTSDSGDDQKFEAIKGSRFVQ